MARITEIKTIKIDCDCKVNPVYLQWQGTNGGANFWLFHTVQAEVENVAITGDFYPYIAELEDALGNGEVLSKEALPQLIIGAYLDVEDISGGINPSNPPALKGLLRSPNVLMLMNPTTWETDGPQWMRVKVAPGTFKILETNQTKAQIELTLLFPTINIQSQ
jgi:hypothetical protein